MIRLFLIILILFIAAPANGLVVEFKQNATIDGVTVTLGDIADFDEDSELSRSLATQTVAQAPSPGQQITLNTQPIIQYFTGIIDQNTTPDWRGAATINVTRNAAQVSSADILHTIDTYLHQKKELLPKAEIRFIPTAQPLPFTIPTGKLSWEVIPSDPDIINSSRFSVIFSVDGRVRKNMSVKGSVEALAQVVVAAHALRKGTILAPGHLAMTKQDISIVKNPCLDPKDIIGTILTSSVKAGTVISLHQVQFPPLIKKGQLVRMIVRRGGLLLTATGIARNDGVINETIRVQNAESHKIVYCRVAAPGVVEVAL